MQPMTTGNRHLVTSHPPLCKLSPLPLSALADSAETPGARESQQPGRPWRDLGQSGGF